VLSRPLLMQHLGYHHGHRHEPTIRSAHGDGRLKRRTGFGKMHA
jgi:hypothetical protein